MHKLRFAALAVVVLGGALLGTPHDASATYRKSPAMYCCEYRIVKWGIDQVLNSCCHVGGCQATIDGCTSL
ncbi:MAG TPA: hypothetical protein VF665_09915 [Longimicrobium sp.]|jgi:hypothetical protein|uniref:hypothetical protein n=1 Tax=Longimicrobium sp. TaxID=2029185 RepID=UPI002EDB9442